MCPSTVVSVACPSVTQRESGRIWALIECTICFVWSLCSYGWILFSSSIRLVPELPQGWLQLKGARGTRKKNGVDCLCFAVCRFTCIPSWQFVWNFGRRAVIWHYNRSSGRCMDVVVLQRGWSQKMFHFHLLQFLCFCRFSSACIFFISSVQSDFEKWDVFVATTRFDWKWSVAFLLIWFCLPRSSFLCCNFDNNVFKWKSCKLLQNVFTISEFLKSRKAELCVAFCMCVDCSERHNIFCDMRRNNLNFEHFLRRQTWEAVVCFRLQAKGFVK